MLKIRMATQADCQAILGIFGYYVLHTVITFEYDVPELAEMETRMKNILPKYPYLVAEWDGIVVGYAYASDFRYRAAYQWSPECTIYLHPDFRGKGIGKLLYMQLFNILRQQGFQNVFGGVALPNESSEALHRACGFKEAGLYENIGYKFNKWHSTKWFQLVLKPYPLNPQPPENINEIKFE